MEIIIDHTSYGFETPEDMLFDGLATAECEHCGCIMSVEPDAFDLNCPECGAESSATSELVNAGLI